MNKAFIFDFDGTLIETDSRIKVKDKNGSRYIDTLYNYTLQEGESYDYSEFFDIEFIRKGRPTFLIHLAKEISEERHDIYILTARGPESYDGIIEYLNAHNITTKDIFCINGENSFITAEKKREILLTLIDRYDKLYYYDDSHENIKRAPVHTKVRNYKI